MTVEWCPKCKAMLPPGLEKCPRCGHKLGKADEFGARDIFSATIYVLGVLLIPILGIVAVGVLCILLFR